MEDVVCSTTGTSSIIKEKKNKRSLLDGTKKCFHARCVFMRAIQR